MQYFDHCPSCSESPHKLRCYERKIVGNVTLEEEMGCNSCGQTWINVTTEDDIIDNGDGSFIDYAFSSCLYEAGTAGMEDPDVDTIPYADQMTVMLETDLRFEDSQ